MEGGKLPPGVSWVLFNLETKFQRLYPCLQGCPLHWCSTSHYVPFSEQFRMAAAKPQEIARRLVMHLEVEFMS
jgi:hypothetical protein